MGVTVSFKAAFASRSVKGSEAGCRVDHGAAPLEQGAEGAALPMVSRAARMLALAHNVERLVEAGELTGYAEAARLLGLTRARVTQVMNLLLLAPEIQERVARGELLISERALRTVLRESNWTRQCTVAQDIVGQSSR